jgi:hypothetical protein
VESWESIRTPVRIYGPFLGFYIWAEDDQGVKYNVGDVSIEMDRDDIQSKYTRVEFKKLADDREPIRWICPYISTYSIENPHKIVEWHKLGTKYLFLNLTYIVVICPQIAKTTKICIIVPTIRTLIMGENYVLVR